MRFTNAFFSAFLCVIERAAALSCGGSLMEDSQPKSEGSFDLEKERRVSVAEAARIKGISEDTFRRNFPELIEQTSERRQGVKIKHII